MTKILKALLTAGLLFFTSFAFADFDQGKSAILGNVGFTNGGLGMGFDYEYGYDRTYGLGAYFRMYSDDQPNHDGLTTFGGFIRPHFNRQAWDFYLSPGFGFMSFKPDRNRSTESLIGPSFAIGLLYDFNTKVSVGVEKMSLYSWFGESDYRGLRSDELMLKIRFIF